MTKAPPAAITTPTLWTPATPLNAPWPTSRTARLINDVLNTATLDNASGDTGYAESPPSPVLDFSAFGYKVRGLQKADLVWLNNTPTAGCVDVLRDNVKIATMPNTGTYDAYIDHIDRRGSGVYV